ncbi:MAG TPA: hypothetical protein VFZ63_06415 [Jiangellaceae bacterium]
MRTRRWVAATAAGILLLAGAPVAAAADEADECADAGLISSLLGKCGLLGAVFGGSESDDEPGAEEPSTPEPGEEDGTGGSGGTSGGTSRTGLGDSGDTTAPSSGTGTSNGGSTATDQRAAPTNAAPGSSTRGSARSSAASSAEADGSALAAGSAPRAGRGAGFPAQVVGPLAPIPQDGDTADAAPLTRPVDGLTLALVAAGVLVAIAVVATARRRSATKPSG